MGSLGVRVGRLRGGGWVDAGGLIREAGDWVGRADWRGIEEIVVKTSAFEVVAFDVDFDLLLRRGWGVVA